MCVLRMSPSVLPPRNFAHYLYCCFYFRVVCMPFSWQHHSFAIEAFCEDDSGMIRSKEAPWRGKHHGGTTKAPPTHYGRSIGPPRTHIGGATENPGVYNVITEAQRIHQGVNTEAPWKHHQRTMVARGEHHRAATEAPLGNHGDTLEAPCKHHGSTTEVP